VLFGAVGLSGVDWDGGVHARADALRCGCGVGGIGAPCDVLFLLLLGLLLEPTQMMLQSKRRNGKESRKNEEGTGAHGYNSCVLTEEFTGGVLCDVVPVYLTWLGTSEHVKAKKKKDSRKMKKENREQKRG
jgi:hypothetical protein